MKKLSSLEMLAAMQNPDGLDPKLAKRLKAMMFGTGSKRGVTKKAFNRVKARAKNKAQKLSRKINRSVNQGKGSCASYGGNGCHRV